MNKSKKSKRLRIKSLLDKNVKTFKAVCPYPPEQEVVYPDLKK